MSVSKATLHVTHSLHFALKLSHDQSVILFSIGDILSQLSHHWHQDVRMQLPAAHILSENDFRSVCVPPPTLPK